MADAPLSTAGSPAPSFTTPTAATVENAPTTSTSNDSPIPKPTKPHAAHVRKFFDSQPYKGWKFVAFDAHCRTFADYAWSHEKIHNFWLKQLNRLLDEKSTLAPTSKIKQLIRGSRHQTRRSSKAKQLSTVSTVFVHFGDGNNQPSRRKNATGVDSGLPSPQSSQAAVKTQPGVSAV